MAINREELVKSMVASMVEGLNLVISGLNTLEFVQEWRSDAAGGDPIDFAEYESGNVLGNLEILGENAENSNYQHLDGAVVNKLLGAVLGGDESVADSVRHHLNNTTVSGGPYNGKTYWEIIQIARRS